MNEPPAGPPRHVLVIDDNPAIHVDFRKILSETIQDGDAHLEDLEAAILGSPTPPLARTGFEVDSAFQGREGLAKVQHALANGRPYALAFVDMRMPPGWDGVETISRLWMADPRLQIVICTAYSDHSWEEILNRVGNTDSLVILKKPFDNIEVLQLAQALCKKWQLSQEVHCRLLQLEQALAARTRELALATAELESARTRSKEPFADPIRQPTGRG